MIACPKCSKDNQDHYKFCLGCGAELPRDAAPKKFTSPGTPPSGVERGVQRIIDEPTDHGHQASSPPLQVMQAAPVATAAPPAPAVAPEAPPAAPSAPSAGADGGGVDCPECGHHNAPSNRFCAECGFKMAAAPRPAAGSPAAAAPVEARPSTIRASLTVLRADGTDAGVFMLPDDAVTVGRDSGGVFAGDSYLSPKHATFLQNAGALFVKDEGSLNGVYRRLEKDAPVELKAGSHFRVGQEILRIEPLQKSDAADGVERFGSPGSGYVGRVALVIGRDATGNAFPIPETGLYLGRERGDVVFPEDGYVSGLHCKISVTDGKIFLTDLGSSNGTFVRLLGESPLAAGQILLMGQQLFRVSL